MYIGSIIWTSSWWLSEYLELEIIKVFTFPTQYFGKYGEEEANVIELFLLDGDILQNAKQILWKMPLYNAWISIHIHRAMEYNYSTMSEPHWWFS